MNYEVSCPQNYCGTGFFFLMSETQHAEACFSVWLFDSQIRLVSIDFHQDSFSSHVERFRERGKLGVG